MRLDIHKEANGKWHSILANYGLNDKQLSKKHTSCPICGGKDRFRLTDYKGNGEWICNQCGNGNGIDLIMRLDSIDFKQAIEIVKPLIGHIEPVVIQQVPTVKIMANLKALFKSATKEVITPYLVNRGITVKPDVWYHPSMIYFNEGNKTFHYGMLGVVSSAEGEAIAAHRTYLTKDGQKANVPEVKKMTSAIKSISGGAIRLFKHNGVLGIAEGIETACAATQIFGIPTWAAICANGMEKFIVPEGVTELHIFADNDMNGTGQKAADVLSKRYKDISVIHVAEKINTDWADYV